MLITVSDIQKSFGEKIILNSSSFTVDDREKIGIVGANGTGKTTLLKMIVGEIPTDSGNIHISKAARIGYISQIKQERNTNNLYEEIITAKPDLLQLSQRLDKIHSLMDACKGDDLEKLIVEYSKLNSEFEDKNGYSYFSEAKGILKGLGFEESEWDKSVDSLSGGEATRLQLGKLLLGSYNLLILDEPTNHLDMKSIVWLENFLKEYKGAVILVSHDRYFMDKIVTKIIDIDNYRLNLYVGNYSDYSKKQQAIRLSYIKAYENQQRELKHQEEVIAKLKSFNREKSVKRAESRQKQLDKIELLDKPQEENFIKLSFSPNKLSSQRILKVEDLEKSYGKEPIFQNINFEIRRGDKVALIGKNGVGKTTILKIINGIIGDYKGKISFGENIDIAYFEQNQENMKFENSIFDEISDTFPDFSNTKIRNALAAFLFRNDDVFKTISTLSGGERGRVALVKLMLSGANFLILDEPTNHLDISSKEILEDAMNEYEGTIFYVSHDRYFINKTANKILELTKDGITEYLGDYDYYLEKTVNTDIEEIAESSFVNIATCKSQGATDWKLAKEREAQKRKIENRIKKLEEEIESLELRIEEIDELLSREDIATNSVKCGELSMEQEEQKACLNKSYEEWERLSLEYQEKY